MARSWRRDLADGAATEALGAALAACAGDGGLLLYLSGELGAGKTTVVRGYLRQCGHSGAVKSPTYTLVEPYELSGRRLYHFDLYRLGAPDELEYLGIRDYLSPETQCLVEWPERGYGVLPEPDLRLSLEYFGEGRVATVEALTPRALEVLACLPAHLGPG